MDRRRFLATIGAGFGTVVAGCLGNAASGHSEEPPDDRVYSSAQTDDMMKISGRFAEIQKKIRCVEDNGLQFVRPQNGVFWSVGVTLEMLGDDSPEVPKVSEFSLRSQGDEYELMESLPEGVEWEQVRYRGSSPNVYWVKPNAPRYITTNAPGVMTLVFDAPKDSTPFIKWLHSGRIENESEPIYLELREPTEPYFEN